MSETEGSAWRLAAQIREYWLKKGYIVGVEVVKLDKPAERMPGKDSGPFWCIRSDMKNGVPTRRISE